MQCVNSHLFKRNRCNSWIDRLCLVDMGGFEHLDMASPEMEEGSLGLIKIEWPGTKIAHSQLSMGQAREGNKCCKRGRTHETVGLIHGHSPTADDSALKCANFGQRDRHLVFAHEPGYDRL